MQTRSLQVHLTARDLTSPPRPCPAAGSKPGRSDGLRLPPSGSTAASAYGLQAGAAGPPDPPSAPRAAGRAWRAPGGPRAGEEECGEPAPARGLYCAEAPSASGLCPGTGPAGPGTGRGGARPGTGRAGPRRRHPARRPRPQGAGRQRGGGGPSPTPAEQSGCLPRPHPPAAPNPALATHLRPGPGPGRLPSAPLPAAAAAGPPPGGRAAAPHSAPCCPGGAAAEGRPRRPRPDPGPGPGEARRLEGAERAGAGGRLPPRAGAENTESGRGSHRPAEAPAGGRAPEDVSRPGPQSRARPSPPARTDPSASAPDTLNPHLALSSSQA